MKPRLVFVAVSLVVAASPAWSEGDSGVLYRCPGNDYNNTLTPSEAEKLHCKKVENAAVSVVRSPERAASASATVPAAAAAAEVRESPESAAMRSRASSSRRQLESRLQSEESKLARLEQEFNGGDPERRKDETNLQTYLDRVAKMRTDITRKQIEIAEMRRELDKLPGER
ncbi:MAG: hypothetical protein JO090_05450 [Rhizobacter sp.]|nr:hypothetical protein [Rhizobacter sp.]